jgi:glycine betaine/proline transport system ATP-binding protein
VSSRLQAEQLYKVFGRRPGEAVERLRGGADREELRADGTTAAVIDASFTVEPGEIFVVMGLSGSGKSTLLRMLNGLLEPTAGRVVFDGQDLTALNDRETARGPLQEGQHGLPALRALPAPQRPGERRVRP